MEELSIGYDFADYVLEDGKICAILIVRKENMESIRVAIKTDGFDSLYHEQIRLSAESEMIMNYGDYGNRKTKVLKSGEILTIEADSEYLQGDRIELIPKVWSGKTEVLSLQRNQGIPIYRGKMEIVKANQGLLLINELLFSEILLYT